jgi:ElaB/YqjD/DUF883 family membrane-anchored ribosome-binding protein
VVTPMTALSVSTSMISWSATTFSPGSDVSRVATLRGRQAAAATDDYVHANPWPVIGAAAGIGVLLGILLSRR